MTNFWIRNNTINTLKGVEEDETNKPLLPASMIHEFLNQYADARKGLLELLPTMLPEEQERLQYILDNKYKFYEKKNWVGVIPVQIGMGSSYLSKNKEKIFKDRVVLYEPSISVEYKWSPWIAVGAGYGYRIMLKNNHQIDQNFYAPIYVMRVRILFDELYARFIEPIREGSH